MSSTYGDSGLQGFQTVSQEDESRKPPRSGLREGFMKAVKDPKFFNHQRLEDPLAEGGLKEMMVLVPAEKDVMATKTVSKGFLIRKKHDEIYISGKAPQTVAEILGNEINEPAYILYYYSAYKNKEYRDEFGRPGNIMNAEIVLPKSVGEDISESIKADPRFVRKLIDSFVRTKYPERFVKEVWEKYGRPPYHKWDAEPTKKFYFADLTLHPDQAELPVSEVLRRAINY